MKGCWRNFIEGQLCHYTSRCHAVWLDLGKSMRCCKRVALIHSLDYSSLAGMSEVLLCFIIERNHLFPSKQVWGRFREDAMCSCESWKAVWRVRKKLTLSDLLSSQGIFPNSCSCLLKRVTRWLWLSSFVIKRNWLWVLWKMSTCDWLVVWVNCHNQICRGQVVNPCSHWLAYSPFIWDKSKLVAINFWFEIKFEFIDPKLQIGCETCGHV